jgi:hypothetical protein
VRCASSVLVNDCGAARRVNHVNGGKILVGQFCPCFRATADCAIDGGGSAGRRRHRRVALSALIPQVRKKFANILQRWVRNREGSFVETGMATFGGCFGSTARKVFPMMFRNGEGSFVETGMATFWGCFGNPPRKVFPMMSRNGGSSFV